MALDSRSNRLRKCASLVRAAGRTLIATVRSRRVSRALQTSPIPPAPRGETISYGPRRVPDFTDIRIGKVYGAVPGAPRDPQFVHAGTGSAQLTARSASSAGAS